MPACKAKAEAGVVACIQATADAREIINLPMRKCLDDDHGGEEDVEVMVRRVVRGKPAVDAEPIEVLSDAECSGGSSGAEQDVEQPPLIAEGDDGAGRHPEKPIVERELEQLVEIARAQSRMN